MNRLPDYGSMSSPRLRQELGLQMGWRNHALNPQARQFNQRRVEAIQRELGRRHRAAKAARTAA